MILVDRNQSCSIFFETMENVYSDWKQYFQGG